MLREAALDTKRRELRNCAGARKRKLSELYNVAATVAAKPSRDGTREATHTTSPATAPLSEAQFQDENDITKGKYFDLSLLDRLPGSDRYPRRAGAGSRLATRRGLVQDGDHDATMKGLGLVTSDKKPLHDSATAKSHSLSRADVGPDTGEDDQRTSTLSQPAVRDVATDTKGLSVDGKSLASSGVSPPNAPPVQVKDADGGQESDLRAAHAFDRNGDTKQEKFPDLDMSSRGQQDTTMRSVPSGEMQAAAGGKQRAKGSEFGLGDDPFIKEGSPGQNRTGTIASRRQATDGRQNGVGAQEVTDTLAGQKAPIRIDTGVARNRSSADFSASINSLTPLRSAQTAMHTSPPERMTTRVSSGALRHKSVSEILGETPKASPSQCGATTPQETTRHDYGQSFRRGSIVASPDSAHPRPRPSETKDRDKERSKLSAVVFARQKGHERARSSDAQSALRKEKSEEEKDYLVPLFAAQASAQTPTLGHLLSTAHKTLTTANHYIDYHESQDCRILKRIYHLQNSNRWSLRQLERAAEPPRPTTQWDALLVEIKWMRTDFREERKWKITAAQNLACWCAEWIAAPRQVRASLQVKARASGSRPSSKQDPGPISNAIHHDATDAEKTPELVESFEGDVSEPSEDDLHLDVLKVPAPATLFSLGPGCVTFGLDKTPMSEKLLSELPQYQPYFRSQDSELSLSEIVDSTWRKPIVPVSKHAIGKIMVQDQGPRRKKSRYQYALEDDVDDDVVALHLQSQKTAMQLPPEQDDVALFSPRNKHIIQRLHATHAFRPPSQHPMPSQQFFEFRYPSQWTVAEDDELRRLVREYEYNWHLISESLSSNSLFSSGAERRTPWECFERWESFEGLPGDMDKHSYFRTWRSRRQHARQQLEQRYLLQQQAGAQVNRRRSAEPMHVEKRRNDKHYALLNAVAKVVKRRETMLQKQQHAAQLAAFRKQPESSQPRLRMQTPQEFSAHKHKQEVEFKEKQLLYRQQMEQNRRAVIEQQRAAQQAGRHQSGLTAPPQNRIAMTASMNAASQRPGAPIAHPGLQNGGRPFSSQNMPAAVLPSGSGAPLNRQQAVMSASGVNVPQAQMQAYMQGQHGGASVQPGQDASRVMTEALRLQEQQRMMQRQVRNQPTGFNGAGHQSPHSALMGNAPHGNKLSSANGIAGSQQRSSASPSVPNSTQGQQLSSGMVPLLNQITNQLKASHPNATTEQIKQMATQNLNIHLRNQNAQAGNNANANANSANSNVQMQQSQQHTLGPNGTPMNAQMYAQFIRSHQANQQNRQTVGTNSQGMMNGGESGRPGSRGTPGSQSRASAPANGRPSSSPRPPQAQMAGSPS